MINIYDYIDPSEYLKDHLKMVKERNSAFSLRAWAHQLGMKSHGPLHAILNGKRNIPKNLVPTLLKSLKLEKKEKEFFEVLVDIQRSKTTDEKELYLAKLQKLSPTPLREIKDIEGYKAITDPLHFMISELSQLKGFRPEVGWMKTHLRSNQNMKDIEDAFNRLVRLGILKEKNGKYHKEVEHLYTKYEIKSESVQACHRFFSQLAMEEITKQTLSEREFNTISFNIQKKDLPEVKEQIRDFVNQLIENFEAPTHQGDETYHLNTQFFSLSKK